MPEKRSVTLHRDGSPIHAEFTVEAVGAHTYKIVSRHTADTIRFHRAGPGTTPGVVNGLTRELLIAVALDSLVELQGGDGHCPENDEAIKYLHRALLALQLRTTARIQQGVAGTMAAHTPLPTPTSPPTPPPDPHPKGAIAHEPDAPQASTRTVGRIVLRKTTVHIGPTILPRDGLATGWSPWAVVEATLKGWPDPVTAAELDFLGQVPTTTPARSGYSEARQALGQPL